LRAIGLLGFTLVWFFIGYITYIKKVKYGYSILLSYLLVEALFYVLTFLSGAFLAQLHVYSVIIKRVFIVGYGSAITGAYYAC
jgi:hypothetical protein